MIDELGPSILGIGIYAASVQQALSHGWGLLESFGAAVFPSVAASVVAYPVIARIAEGSQRRQNHKEHLVSRAVDPAIHVLRNSFHTEAVSRILGYQEDHCSLQPDQTFQSIVRDTNEWCWLREHEPEVGELADELEETRTSFIDTYNHWREEIADTILDCEPVHSLGIDERTAGRIAHTLLQHAARREQGGTPGPFRNELHVNKYQHGTELVSRGTMFAKGEAETVQAFVEAVVDLDGSELVQQAIAELDGELTQLRGVESELRQRFDRMAAERAPRGSCTVCQLDFLDRLRR